MAEKVLGFKKDSVWMSKCKVKGRFYYNVFDDKLVPVVSVEEIKKWYKSQCKEVNKNKPTDVFDDGYNRGYLQALENLKEEYFSNPSKDLLSAVRKQAKAVKE